MKMPKFSEAMKQASPAIAIMDKATRPKMKRLSSDEKVRFMCYQAAMNSHLFLKRLVKDCQRKIFLIIDNLPVHHSKPMQKWLVEDSDATEFFYLSCYSPELNPDECLNRDFKQSGAIPPARNKNQLERQLASHMKSI